MVKSHSVEMGETNRNLNHELKVLRSEVNINRENLKRKEKRVEKLRNQIYEYRENTMRLVSTVEAELDRIRGMDPEEVPNHLKNVGEDIRRRSSRLIENNDGMDTSCFPSPIKSAYSNNIVNIEKTQERYESMLDGQVKINKDKERMINNLEEK